MLTEKESVSASGSTMTFTFSGAPASGELILLTCFAAASDTTGLTPPAGFTKDVESTRSGHSIAVFRKIAGAGEPTSYDVTGPTTSSFGVGSVFQGDTVDAVGETANGLATNTTSVTPSAAITGDSGAFVFAAAFYDDGDQVGSWDQSFAAVHESTHTSRTIETASREGDGTSLQPTFSVPSQATRFLIAEVEYQLASANTSPSAPTLTIEEVREASILVSLSAFSDSDAGDALAGAQVRWDDDEGATGTYEGTYTEGAESATNFTSASPYTIDASGITAGSNVKAGGRHKDDSGDAATEYSAWGTDVETWLPYSQAYGLGFAAVVEGIRFRSNNFNRQRFGGLWSALLLLLGGL